MSSNFGSKIAGAKPTGTKGNRPRLGRHLVRISLCKFAKKAEPPNDEFVALELEVLQTLHADGPGGNLTEDEKKAGRDAYAPDEPHLKGEMIAVVWVNGGRAAQMFYGNVAGFLLAVQQQLYTAMKSEQDAGNDIGEMLEVYVNHGFNLCALEKDGSPKRVGGKLVLSADRLAVLNDSAPDAVFGAEQPLAGVVELVLNVTRTQKKDKTWINVNTFRPLTQSEYQEQAAG